MQMLQPTAPKKTPAQAAFTLVEVMMSAMIAAVVFAGLFYALNQGTTMIQQERENLRATQIINGRLEAIRLCAWGYTSGSNSVATQLFNQTIVPTNFVDYFYPATLGGFATNSMTYQGTITVETNIAFFSATTNGTATAASPPNYSNLLARVTVAVSWSEVHYGITNLFSRTNRTFVSFYGLQNYLTSQ